MIEIRQAEKYAQWFSGLRDRALVGGDKRTQGQDIGTAIELARNL